MAKRLERWPWSWPTTAEIQAEATRLRREWPPEDHGRIAHWIADEFGISASSVYKRLARTKERYLEHWPAIRAWVSLYGSPPTFAEWTRWRVERAQGERGLELRRRHAAGWIDDAGQRRPFPEAGTLRPFYEVVDEALRDD